MIHRTFILRLAIVTLAIMTLQSSVRGQCNVEAIDGCIWSPWTRNFTAILTYSGGGGCPPCSVTVTFDYRICNSSMGIREQYQMTSFTPDTACYCLRSFLDSLKAANIGAYWGLIENMSLDLNRILLDKVFLDSYNGSENKLPFNCDQAAPSCHSAGNLQNHIISVLSSCQEYIEIGPGASAINPGGCAWQFVIAHCPGEACCILRRSYCWDTTLNAPRVCETWDHGSGSGYSPCTGNAEYTKTDGCVILSRSGCRPTLCD